MGTSDWSLPRVTSIAQAGGAALCSSAVAMAADKLLSWMQGSKYTVHLYNKHLDRGFVRKENRGFPSFRAFHDNHVGLQRVQLESVVGGQHVMMLNFLQKGFVLFDFDGDHRIK